jgi:hypothetical protein
MQTILRFVPGVTAAAVAFVVTKLVGWTEIGFEFGAFLTAYLVVAASVDRAMKRYGAKSA